MFFQHNSPRTTCCSCCIIVSVPFAQYVVVGKIGGMAPKNNAIGHLSLPKAQWLEECVLHRDIITCLALARINKGCDSSFCVSRRAQCAFVVSSGRAAA